MQPVGAHGGEVVYMIIYTDIILDVSCYKCVLSLLCACVWVCVYVDGVVDAVECVLFLESR